MSPMPVPSRDDLKKLFRDSAHREDEYQNIVGHFARRYFWRVTVPTAILIGLAWAGYHAIKIMARLQSLHSN